ncbi:hypothetical protein [Mucisphaera calidilacus]|uniref:Uncharacterized protein n=1 Tax=Mucisphaera calidilacus TaxID=2527982 RepID=A0A518BV60_9BACT|nr:hypothetical protein [Mucisphaera calidilacus]QDU70872.1 hypothetical protein Pan265_07130 [Mucisphaera calidilacus]
MKKLFSLKTGRWWKLPFLTLVLLLSAYTLVRVWIQISINAEIQHVRTQGLPITLAELETSFPSPQTDNAADDVIAACRLMHSDPDQRFEATGFWRLGASARAARAIDFVQKNPSGCSLGGQTGNVSLGEISCL